MTTPDVAVRHEAQGWTKADATLARRAARTAYESAYESASEAAETGEGEAASVTIVLGDSRLLHELNRRFRKRDAPTDVLSFPAMPAPEAHPRLLGDVVIAREAVADYAEAHNLTLADRLAHLVVHGTLHLLGFDHAETKDAARMEALECAALAQLGLAAPYTPDDAPDDAHTPQSVELR